MTLHSDLVQARAALRAGQWETAAALARRALDRDPADVEADLLLGLSLEARGRSQEAVAALAAAARPGPNAGAAVLPAEAAAAMARLLPAALPERLAPELLAALPGAGPVGIEGTASYRVVAPRGAMPTPVTDPKYGWKFPRRAAVYIGAVRRYSLYYQQAEDGGLAIRVGELLGQLEGAAGRLATRPPRPVEVRVWLARAGRAGGEQYRDSIYLFAVDVARSDSEWVREVSHEVGHIALPSFAHFDAPEPMENGYLGERLLPKWLLDLGQRSVWGSRVSLADYLRQRTAPLRAAFLNAGPGSLLRTDRGPAGMNYAIGMVLALEAQHGPEFLGRVIARNSGAGLESLLLAYREEVAAAGPYHLPVDLVVPDRSRAGGVTHGRLRFRRAAYRAFLPSGQWTLTTHGARLTGLRASVDGRPLPVSGSHECEAGFSLTTDVSRWHLIQLEARVPGAALAEITLTPAAPLSRAAAVGSNHPRALGRQDGGAGGAN